MQFHYKSIFLLCSQVPDQVFPTNPPPHAEKEKETEEKKETAEDKKGNQQAGNNNSNSVRNDTAAQKQISKNIDAIDDLLGTLSSDMEKMGVHTAAKGHCASCGKCIAGKVTLKTDQGQNSQHVNKWVIN